MKKTPIYSRNPLPTETMSPKPMSSLFRQDIPSRWQAIRNKPFVFFIAGILLTSALFFSWNAFLPKSKPLTQDIIDEAVLKTLNTKELPSKASKAAQTIMPSVVMVRAFKNDADEKKKKDSKKDDGEDGSLGTGVVVMEDGTILTNYHVIAASDRVEVIFYDGTKSNAKVVAVHPHNDLAILKPEKLPDDLLPATLGSSAQLKYGEDVVAVGFPFGIGPSVTSGVVSGLRREFTGENGAQLRNLIQFDAAINQGNSGGPLINSAGEVVGIVTALLNPSSTEKTFIGIGFAVTIESAGSAVGIPPF
jgi:S1-C subfamily serine protease